jgi:hypothetical protein
LVLAVENKKAPCFHSVEATKSTYYYTWRGNSNADILKGVRIRCNGTGDCSKDDQICNNISHHPWKFERDGKELFDWYILVKLRKLELNLWFEYGERMGRLLYLYTHIKNEWLLVTDRERERETLKSDVMLKQRKGFQLKWQAIRMNEEPY